MRLFSEKVTPTFTSSNQNILTIKDFDEIFFDVYELEINGSKYIAEKISEYKGNPVVNIPIVIDGRELEAPFVIQRGDFEVIFNESNSTFIKVASSEIEEVFIEEKNRDEEVEEIIFEKKESILEEIKQARQAATKFAESVQQKNIRRDRERTNRDKEVLAETASNFKKVLLEEFLSITENTREELFTYNQQENEKTYEYITDTVDRLAEKLTQDLNEEIASQQKSIVKKFEKDISSLAQNILTDKLLKEIAVNNSENIKTADIRFETVSKTLTKFLSDHEVQLDIKIKKALGSYDAHITALEQSNIELNDSITKNTNKALSRIGNVKTQLEESIDILSIELVDKITLAESKIKDYYNDRITLIESSVTDIKAKDKAYILELIEESKQSILKEVNEIKSSVPTLVTERTLEPKGDVDVKKIKTDLEKSISNRFSQELANIRRVIELSSGGGSVAMQFADGGTMNGNLTVVGSISASGTITAGNMILSGNQVATVVDPVRTTLTGNGVLSAFAISGAGLLTNPSALIVAIDGAMQEPTVDYAVGSGQITFTSPLPNGSKAVVISPTNTLQVTQMIPADGSVTSAKLANDLTLTNAVINGTANFTSTTRPTSSGTGTPAATSLITLTDAVDFITNPNNIIVRDDFINGGSTSQTIGDLGWFSSSAGGGTGSSITGPLAVFPNIGARILTCGNATNAGQVIYLPSITSLLTYAGWEFCFVAKLNQTTDCDLIVGLTKDNGAIGIGKFGGISFGARYSSATDTDFMFYSKNTNLTFAANDASNYAISSGVVVGTTYNTFRIRSIVAGALQMSINGGSFVAVDTSLITTTGIFIPFFYIATRTTTSKSIDVDFFSMKIQGVAR